MAAVSRLRFRLRPAVLVLAVAFPLGVAEAPPTAAQGWFGGFFGGGPQQSPYGGPRYSGYGYDYGGRPNAYRAPRRRTVRRQAPALKQAPAVQQAQDPAAAPKTPAKAATVFVDVFGDSFGQLLANGLDDALADKAEVGVLHLGRGSSGLVNDAYYDWPKTINDLLAHQGKSALNKPVLDKAGPAKPAQDQDKDADGAQDRPRRIDVAVMMIGSNDRQPIVQDGKRLQPGSDEWNVVYRKRVMAIDEAFQRKKIPLVWVGVPIVRNDDFADDMAALNDIYRDAAAKTGATFVDVWEAFSDDKGEFAAYGPDINGQTVRLRTTDGIYFTKAGARKLAHFVEAHVRRDLDGKTPLPQLPTADAPAADTRGLPPGKPAVALVKPEAGPIKNLSEAPAAKDGHLTDVAQFKTDAIRDAIVANTLIKGQPDPAPAGRADNFRWPAGGDEAH